MSLITKAICSLIDQQVKETYTTCLHLYLMPQLEVPTRERGYKEEQACCLSCEADWQETMSTWSVRHAYFFIDLLIA